MKKALIVAVALIATAITFQACKKDHAITRTTINVEVLFSLTGKYQYKDCTRMNNI